MESSIAQTPHNLDQGLGSKGRRRLTHVGRISRQGRTL